MPVTKWKNIIAEPDEEKRNIKIDKLTEKDSKDFLKFIVTQIRDGSQSKD